MRVALVQMTSSADWRENLEGMEKAVAEAAGQKAQVVAFPEMAALMARPEQWAPVLPQFSEWMKRFEGWARKHSVWLLPGSLREPAKQPGRFYNTLPLFSPNGLVAQYRKIFLFKATLPDRVYDEGRHCEAGNEVVTAPIADVPTGVGICYDLRFPELFRALRKKGARIAFLPAAFTVPTGIAHWHSLLRARAIENQIFLLAPAQVGTCGDGAKTFGHSLAVSPWGEVLLDMGEAPGIGVVDLDLSQIEASKAKVDSWASRREDLFPN